MNFELKIIEYFTNWTKQKIRIHHADISDLYFREREVWWASIGANIGFEQNGKHDSYERPVVIPFLIKCCSLNSKIRGEPKRKIRGLSG